ncbi:MAG: bifunctional oligoribonuclease/PAP phosphatase NrnA [Muribaculaceae bacterium]|nr:bifunctional oligoribonuclease/PAP phosphatase NrnA [Muribaculaceae bacterium]
MIQPIIDSRVIDKVQHLLNGVKSIAITCHLSPDGDAIGSTLALCHVLRRLGKDANVVTPDMMPRSLLFLPDVRSVISFTQQEARARKIIEAAQLIFCLDFNALHRIDKLGQLVMANPCPRVLIDHHVDPEPMFDVMISFPDASSTCELVYRVLMQMQLLKLVDRWAAQCLLTGMMTDTGNFAYNCEDPDLYEIQASLMRRKVGRQWLYNMAMNTFSADSMRLQGYAMDQKMKLYPEQHASLIVLTADELKRYNYKRGDSEGLVNKPLAIPGVEWSVFMREDPEYVKVSCRSVGDFAVNDICTKYFNGGGHVNAAGGEFYGTLDQAVATFEQLLLELFPNVPVNNETATNNEI